MRLLSDSFAAVANHLLGQADWARARLAEHAGKRARIELPLFAMSLDVTKDGCLEPAHAEGLPDLVIELPPPALAHWLVDRDQAWRQARVDGDAEFASALSFVAANLHWEFEEDLSQVVGDIPAHRIGRALRAAAQWSRQVAASAAINAAEFLTEEKHMLATRLHSDEFLRAVDELRDAAERLDKRLTQLEQASAKRPQH